MFGANGSVWLNMTLMGGSLPLMNTTVRGFVNDSEGFPVDGAEVEFYNVSYDWDNWTFTDGSGFFEVMVFGGDFEVEVN